MKPPQAVPLWVTGFALVVIGASAARLLFAVEFTDEAFYATLPYRFVLGDTPYVSDLGVAQNAGILTLPLVKLWVATRGDVDGLILFLRCAHLALRVALVVLAVRALWNRAPRSLVVVASLLVCAFVFLAIPTLSYNTLASSAVTAALLCFLLWGESGRNRYAAATFVSAAIAAYVHPALAVVAAGLCAATIVCSPSDAARRNSWRALVIIVALLASVAVTSALAVGGDNIRRLINEAGTYGGPSIGFGLVLRMPGRLLDLSRGGWVIAAIWPALWFARKLPPLLVSALAVVYVGLAMTSDIQAAMVWLAAASLPLAWNVWRASGEIDLLVAAGFSALTGFTMALFSTNGVTNAAVGSEVAGMLCFVTLFRLLHETPPDRGTPGALSQLPLVLAGLSVVGFAVTQWRNVYRDDPVRSLSVTVPDGPYRWLRTTPEKAAYLERVQSALRKFSAGHVSLLVFNRFPGAHLMVTIPPATPMTWVADATNDFTMRRRRGIARYIALAREPMLVLQVFRLPTTTTLDETWTYAEDDPLMQAVIAKHPKTLVTNAEFSILEINGRP